MELTIRNLTNKDITEYVAMCRDFYSMPCCDHIIPDEHFYRTADYVLCGATDYAVLILDSHNEISGYSTLSISYSQEAGGKVVLIDELYIKPSYQGKGYGSQVIDYIRQHYPAARYRLEVTASNTGAIKLYERLGFEHLHYLQMIDDKTI